MSSQTVFLFFIPFLSLLLLVVNLVIATHNPYGEKKSPFECGFSSFLYQNRTQFNISFFIFALLFLLFDLEILLIYPYSISSSNNIIYGLIIMLIFFILLTLGFVFELGKSALTIHSKQYSEHMGSMKSSSKAYIMQSSVLSKYMLIICKIFRNLKKRVFNINTFINILSSTFSGLLIRSLFMLFGTDILHILKNPLLSAIGLFLSNTLRLFINELVFEIIYIKYKIMSNMIPAGAGSVYDPLGIMPPNNNRELYALIQYRLLRIHATGGAGDFPLSYNYRITQILGTDNLVNNGAKQMLCRYILDNREELSTAYRQLVASTDKEGNIRWSGISIGLNSPIMRSLANS